MSESVLEVRGLSKTFARRGAPDVEALRGVGFELGAGERLGIVGQSGSGKSTLARIVMRFEEADAGSVRLCGRDVTHAEGAELARAYRQMQMVFQDPADSFDPRKTLGEGIAEGLRNAGASKEEAQARVRTLMEDCGLDPALAARHPRQVSGGQCQRAAIARALAPSPQLLVCDEATSALDATVQRQIVRLLAHLSDEHGLALLFICHDIALVAEVCDRVVVMSEGRVAEQGPTEQVLRRPQSAATKELLAARL